MAELCASLERGGAKSIDTSSRRILQLDDSVERVDLYIETQGGSWLEELSG